MKNLNILFAAFIISISSQAFTQVLIPKAPFYKCETINDRDNLGYSLYSPKIEVQDNEVSVSVRSFFLKCIIVDGKAVSVFTERNRNATLPVSEFNTILGGTFTARYETRANLATLTLPKFRTFNKNNTGLMFLFPVPVLNNQRHGGYYRLEYKLNSDGKAEITKFKYELQK